MRFRDRPIEQKIFLLILPICLVPALVFLLLVVVGTRITFEKSIGSEIVEQAASISGKFDAFVKLRMETLKARMRSPSGVEQLIREVEQSDWINAIVLKEPGTPLRIFLNESNSGNLRDPLRDAAGKFDALLESRPAIVPTGLFTDMDLAIPGQLQPSRLAIFAYPHGDGGLLFFVYTIDHLLRQFRQGLDRVPDLFLIHSSSGVIVYRSLPLSDGLQSRVKSALVRETPRHQWLSIAAGERTFLMAPQVNNELQTLARENRSGTVWTFVLLYDMETFLGPQDSLIWLSVLLELGLVLVLLGLASITARYLVGPLQTLGRQAERLARGEPEVRASVNSRDEIGQLAESFNQMAARLRLTHATLEERAKESQLRAEHINVINQIANAIIQARDLSAIFEIISRQMSNLLQYDAMWIAMLLETRDLRVTHTQPTVMISHFDRGRIPLRRSLHGQVIERGETLHAEVGEARRAEFHETRIFRTEGFQSFLIAPLPARDRIIGTLTVASKAPDAYNQELTDVMTSLAGAVAIAIEQADLFQRISQFAWDLERKVDERTRELELATDKLIQTEKYFATGRLAGNLAHEINNPLGIIKNYLQLVKNNLSDASGGRRRTDPNLGHIQIIDEEVNRIARLVRQLLSLHRPVEQKVEPVDVNEVIEEILALIEEDLKRNRIEVVREFSWKLPRPLASKDLVRQLLINLIRNAQDAMEHGGTLTLRTSAIIEWRGGEEEQLVRIRVSDTGHGIPPENLSQIFEPFYTTKSDEKGTGLGLSVSYSIVRMYQGMIDVESAPGAGSHFIVTLPVLKREDLTLPEGMRVVDLKRI